MSQRTPNEGVPIGRIIVTAGIFWLLYAYPPGASPHPGHEIAWWCGVVLGGIGIVQSLPGLAGFGNVFRALRAVRNNDSSKGSAAWLTPREARRHKLHRKPKGARFVGVLGNVPLHLNSETSQLIIAPSGAGKTTTAMIPLLCDSPFGALVSDIKKELFETTAEYRARQFGHRIVLIDPSDPERSVRINPMDRVSIAMEADDPAALTRARGLTKQLLQDPQGGAGANQVFNDGARLQIATVILAVTATFKPKHRTLTSVQQALSDSDLLERTLLKAMETTVLNREVASMARALWEQGFGEHKTRTFEQFRLNAQLALELFGPGGHIAQITSETTFSFKELKGKCTCYISIDFASAEVMGKFSSLMQWQAAQEIIEVGDNRPVTFCLDEFCNAPLHGIAKILTLTRTYGIRCILATQDLDDIERVYGKHVLETVLSECEVAQFLSGVRSEKTLEYLSKRIGETTETTESFAMGETVQETLSRGGRRLVTPDEVRQLPQGAQIIFKGNLKPILSLTVPVFAQEPARRRIAANSLYGGKPKLMPIEMRRGWLVATVTPLGQKRYRAMVKAMRRPGGPGLLRRLTPLLRLIVPGPSVLVVLALACGAYWQGLPNLRVAVDYGGTARSTPGATLTCRYVGPISPGVITSADCPPILWRKTW